MKTIEEEISNLIDNRYSNNNAGPAGVFTKRKFESSIHARESPGGRIFFVYRIGSQLTTI